MNSLVVSRASLYEKKAEMGFTLIELLLVVAITLAVSSFMFPLSISFYRMQMLDETEESIASLLRKAQTFSVTGKNDSAYGVKILDDAYVLFEGETYASRDAAKDEAYPFASTISVSGLSEVTFLPFSGEPTATGTVHIVLGDKTAVVSVISSGVVDH